MKKFFQLKIAQLMYFNVKFCSWVLKWFGLYVQFRIINEEALENDKKSFQKIVNFFDRFGEVTEDPEAKA